MSAKDTTTRLRVAYLVNQYPKVSHSFIRREILALEQQGVEVLRLAHRGWDAEVVDGDDQLERDRTKYLLQQGAFFLLATCAITALTRPVRWLGALSEAWKLSRGSDRGLIPHLAYFALACTLQRELQRSKAQHLHAHFGTNSAAVAHLTRTLGGPPFSFTVHGPEEFDKPEALHLARKTAATGFVVAVSSFGRSQLWRRLPAAEWEKVKVVHCGLDAGFLDAERDDTALHSHTLVCVGRLCEQKGQLLLIEALQQLVGDGIAVNLVLAGDGEMRIDIEAAIHRHGLQAQVRITGWISAEQVRQEIISARALVLPSFAEGLPVVIMEALALRRPVISTFVAGIPELVTSGEGWLVPAGSVEALARAMRECLSYSAAQLAEMGERGRMKVLARHNVDAEAAKLATQFRESAQSAAAGRT